MLISLPDGSVKTLEIPDDEETRKFVQQFYPGAIIHGKNDQKLREDSSLKPYIEDGTEKVYCGRDIGDNLRKGLARLDSEFTKLPMSKKIEIANSLRKLPRALTAWDIQTLIGDNLSKFRVNGNGWGEGAGAQFVTVDGKCYLAPAVNYILWGRINRLVFAQVPEADRGGAHGLDWTLTTAQRYRKVKSAILDSGGVRAQSIWAEVGWTGNWALAPKAQEDSRRYVPCPTKFQGGLAWRIAPAGITGDRTSIADREGQKGIIEFVE